MRCTLVLPALVSLAASQLIDLVAIGNSPDPVLVAAPFGVVTDTPPDVPADPIEPITEPPSRVRRNLVQKRDGNCAPQPTGSGPVSTPDTVAAFKSNPDLQALSTNAATPDGYTLVFSNKDASLSASNYMGLQTLKSYDTFECASKCDQASGCQAFNFYIERDPSLDPNKDNCPNPPSVTNYKCTLWGAPVAVEEATNRGQYRDSFQVVITGSNAYNKVAPPDPINGYNGPTPLGGAINAPLNSKGQNTYLGYKFFPFSQSQGYDTQTCADACNVQTGYNSRHPAADGTYQTCVFFNAYVLSQNGIPQGLYCSLYNETWAPSYATNRGQTRGSDRYTISRSYSYSLKNPPDPSTSTPKDCPSGPVLQNPSFEENDNNPPTGWQTDIDGAVLGSTSPGSPNSGSSKALAVEFAQGGSFSLSQTLNACPGQNYSIAVDFKYDLRDEDPDKYCTFAIKYPYKNTFGSVTGTNKVPGENPGEWTSTGSTFQAVSKDDKFFILVNCYNGTPNRYSIDNVKILPYSGNAY